MTTFFAMDNMIYKCDSAVNSQTFLDIEEPTWQDTHYSAGTFIVRDRGTIYDRLLIRCANYIPTRIAPDTLRYLLDVRLYDVKDIIIYEVVPGKAENYLVKKCFSRRVASEDKHRYNGKSIEYYYKEGAPWYLKEERIIRKLPIDLSYQPARCALLSSIHLIGN